MLITMFSDSDLSQPSVNSSEEVISYPIFLLCSTFQKVSFISMSEQSYLIIVILFC